MLLLFFPSCSGYTSRVDSVSGARRRIILDDRGTEIRWLWEHGSVEVAPAGAIAHGQREPIGGQGHPVTFRLSSSVGPG